MLSGLRVDKNSESKKDKKDKKDKKEKEEATKEKKKKEKKKKKDKKGKKERKLRVPDSSSSKSSSSAGSGEEGQGGKRPTEPEAKRQTWMVKQAPSTGEADDFFSRLGSDVVKPDGRVNGMKPDPDKPVVSKMEYNPFMRGEVSDQPEPVASGQIPSHLKVGDGGSAWRKRSQLRARQVAADDAEELEKKGVGKDSVADKPAEQPARRSERVPDKPTTDEFGRRSERARPAPTADVGDDTDDIIRQMQLKYSAKEGKKEESAAPLEEEEDVDANTLGAMAMEAMLSGDMARYEVLNQRLERKQASLAAPPAPAGAGKSEAATAAEEAQGPGGKRVKVLEEVDAGGRNKELVESIQTTSVRTKGRNKRGTANAIPGKGGELSGFYEDDNVSLDDLVRRERIEGVQDYDSNFAHHVIKKGAKFKMVDADEDEAYNLADYEHSSKKMDGGKRDDKRRRQEINDKQRIQVNLDHCTFCTESRKFGRKDAIISASQHAYLCMEGMNQCILPEQVFIAPMEHVQAITDLDDSAYAEIRNYQKCLVRFFEAQNPPRAVMFAESAVHRVTRDRALLGAGPHAIIVAYAVEYDLLSEARAYWKKAFDEAEDEFITQHKKVIETDAKSGVRSKIPKNFAYVHVDFALSGGYAHVVEDAAEFPRNFVQHTVAGMCELTVLDRAYNSKEAYRNACADFKKRFKEVDWTQGLR